MALEPSWLDNYMLDSSKNKRIVVTGIGLISPLGCTVHEYWEGLVSGKSGIRRITQFDASNFPSQIAGEIPDFNPRHYMDKKDARRMPRSAQIALAASQLAIQDANYLNNHSNPDKCGVVFGTGMGGFDLAYEGIETLRKRGVSKVNPFTIPGCLPNLSAFLISKTFRFLGPNVTITTACASSTQAIGEGTEFIRRNVADIVIAGGTEALIKDFSFGGFSAMRALPTHFNDAPTKASRPFDSKREGFVFSEGSGVLILESLEHAKSRGAKIYAEILGHSSSSDGYHIAAPDPNGNGPIRAMNLALLDAKISPDQVDYINAHGSSTLLNDEMETKAIKSVFGMNAYKIPISSTKSMIGHPMGASGALEAIACILAINENIIPPTINYDYPDPSCDLDYVPNKYRKIKHLDIALSNSFGLGGQNACLVIKNYKET